MVRSWKSPLLWRRHPAGTLAPGACRVSVDTKNAFNNGIGSANVGGFWGPELKFAGFDNLIVSGKAGKPVYLWIHDGKIEIRDAAFIWGKTTWETEERIRDELGDERIRVAAIGVAGENMVRSSCIICDGARCRWFWLRCGHGIKESQGYCCPG